MPLNGRERGYRLARPPQPGFQQRRGSFRFFATGNQRLAICKKAMRVCRTALDQIVPEIIPLASRDRREPVKPVIRLVVSRQNGHFRTMRDGAGVQGLQP